MSWEAYPKPQQPYQPAPAEPPQPQQQYQPPMQQAPQETMYHPPQQDQQQYRQPYQQDQQYQRPPYQQNQYGQGGWNRGQNAQGGNGFGNRMHQPPVENPVLYQPYAVMGNKEIPPKAMEDLIRITHKLKELGFIHRTGIVEGVEEAIDKAVYGGEVYLPWKGFGNRESKNTFNSPLAKGIAKKFAPNLNWETLKPAIQAFMAKNVRVLTGQNCNSLAMFLLCWSEDGAESATEKTFATGNLGHAISVAAAHRIPIFNLGKPDAEKRLYQFLGIQQNGQI